MNEVRLIDANALKMRRSPNTSNTGGNNSFYYIKKEDVDNAPTVDAVLVEHGHWIAEYFDKDFGDHLYGECSHCHRLRAVDNFCAHCGAKMDEVVE